MINRSSTYHYFSLVALCITFFLVYLIIYESKKQSFSFALLNNYYMLNYRLGGNFMTTKILACDLDGTLIKYNDGPDQPRSVLEADKQAITDYMNEGNIYIVSTGRASEITFPLFDRIELNLTNAYYITSNGSEIFDKERKCIYRSRIKQEKIYDIYQLYLEFNINDTLDIELYNGIKRFTSKDIQESKDLEMINPLINVCVASKNSSIDESRPFYEKAKEVFKDLTITMNNWYVDLVPMNTSKAIAIQFILDKEQLTKENLYAVGDSWNDVSMFEIAKGSYTFNNSPKDVIMKADKSIDHLHECIYDIINKDSLNNKEE